MLSMQCCLLAVVVSGRGTRRARQRLRGGGWLLDTWWVCSCRTNIVEVIWNAGHLFHPNTRLTSSVCSIFKYVSSILDQDNGWECPATINGGDEFCKHVLTCEIRHSISQSQLLCKEERKGWIKTNNESEKKQAWASFAFDSAVRLCFLLLFFHVTQKLCLYCRLFHWCYQAHFSADTVNANNPLG